tara:strand:- start:27644 stop:28189 length:546 start_codon:yes stop_codon:yes gene_type:complete
MNFEVSHFTREKLSVIYKALEAGVSLSSAEAEANLPPGTLRKWVDIAKREIKLAEEEAVFDPTMDLQSVFEEHPIIVFYMTYRALQAKVLRKAKKTVLDKIDEGSVSAAKWWLERYEQTEKQRIQENREKVRLEVDRLSFLKLLKDIAPVEFERMTRQANIDTSTAAEILTELNRPKLDGH